MHHLNCEKTEDAERLDALHLSMQPARDNYSIRSRFSGMTIQRAIDFAKDFEICPTLLSEAECRGIYSEVATRQVVVSTTSSRYFRSTKSRIMRIFCGKCHGERHPYHLIVNILFRLFLT